MDKTSEQREIWRRIAEDQPAFAGHLGMRLIEATPDRVEMTMAVTDALANRNGVLHGGAIMALADNAGGTATFLNLPEGKSTTTLESKTNFLRPLRLGDTAHAVCEPLHRGRTTMIWQTRILRDDGKVAAIVTQTQMVIDWQG
ncbi:PaaI family thioesterase (plasmid) [Paracoccus sp. TK19116]|uniref:PaaI family thioesterase n=1 Tax=Paracoccus albicereus TaxID=2922394 RepID=A0ABT1MMV7_9RHOB|nr:PaaI family thioesterase [Paracoccus albicereus]MCQ0969444.1 PaaI family thioesterase [Paracoccus albicereus]